MVAEVEEGCGAGVVRGGNSSIIPTIVVAVTGFSRERRWKRGKGEQSGRGSSSSRSGNKRTEG